MQGRGEAKRKSSEAGLSHFAAVLFLPASLLSCLAASLPRCFASSPRGDGENQVTPPAQSAKRRSRAEPANDSTMTFWGATSRPLFKPGGL